MLTVRAVFGYSFATWRFHRRGEAILGGEDIGWMRDTTAAALMSHDMKTIPAATPIGEVCSLFPLGSVKWVAVVGGNGAFMGLADIALVHAARLEGTAGDHIVHADAWIDGNETIGGVLAAFEAREIEILVVTGDSSKVLGYVTEAFALRRYRQELDRRRDEIFGNGM
jgi:CIC family chloride channel protein